MKWHLFSVLVLSIVSNLGCVSSPTMISESPWRHKHRGDIENVTLHELAARWWEHKISRFPTWGTYLGDRRYHGRLQEITPEAGERFHELTKECLEDSYAIRLSDLSESERITLALLQEEWRVAIAQFKSGVDELSWNVDPLSGPQSSFLSLAADQPVGTPAERQQALARWKAIPVYLDQVITNQWRGIANERVASHTAVKETIEQLDKLLETPIEESPLVTLATEHGTKFERQMSDVVRGEIYPAFERYRNHLRDHVLVLARPDERPGVLHVPGGKQFYRTKIREHTSLDLDPDEIHEIGLVEVARIRSEMSELGKKVFDTRDIVEIQNRLRTDPALHFQSAGEVQAVATETLQRAIEAVPAHFGLIPKAECVVVPIPEHEAPYTTIAYYRGPSSDADRPGRYYINTYRPETRPRYEAEVLALHEAVPGHHTQRSIAMELSELPIVRRHFDSTAFVEGWALYTERLGDEIGLYSGDLDRFGILSFDAWRACRLVVDTGLHAKGWSRKEAIDYMLENTLLAHNNVENEVDRYIARPGQALAYKLGQLEILKLRAEAQAALEHRFSLSDFHDRVLENGAVTLEVLAERIRTWIARSSG